MPLCPACLFVTADGVNVGGKSQEGTWWDLDGLGSSGVSGEPEVRLWGEGYPLAFLNRDFCPRAPANTVPGPKTLPGGRWNHQTSCWGSHCRVTTHVCSADRKIYVEGDCGLQDEAPQFSQILSIDEPRLLEIQNRQEIGNDYQCTPRHCIRDQKTRSTHE